MSAQQLPAVLLRGRSLSCPAAAAWHSIGFACQAYQGLCGHFGDKGLECSLHSPLPFPDTRLTFRGEGPFGELPLQSDLAL